MRSVPARACSATATMPGEHAHRRQELHEVGGEGEERADADLALDGQPPAEGEHADLAEGGDGLERRLVPRLEPHGAHPRTVEALGGVGEAGQLAVLLAEALHDPHAADRFVDHARDLAGALQRVPLGREHRRAATAATRTAVRARSRARSASAAARARASRSATGRAAPRCRSRGGGSSAAPGPARGRSSRARRSDRWAAGRDGRSRGAARARRSWCAGRAARRTRIGRRRTDGCTRARS